MKNGNARSEIRIILSAVVETLTDSGNVGTSGACTFTSQRNLTMAVLLEEIGKVVVMKRMTICQRKSW